MRDWSVTVDSLLGWRPR